MLKKNDLAKQFELLTKQEIKNYNNSLDVILQSIRDLNIKIDSMGDEFLENQAAIHSMQCQMATDLTRNSDDIKKITSKSMMNFVDQRDINDRNEKQFVELADAINNIIRSDDYYQKNFNRINEEMSTIYGMSENTIKIIFSIEEGILKKIDSYIKQLKKEILETPTEVSLVEKKLEEKIDCHKIDVAGIMRELKVFKKDNIYTEKKIEDLYNQIEGLQKKASQ